MSTLRGKASQTGRDHRATPFELFFDLVYVFAITQITGHMAREGDAEGVLQGLMTLALLWGTWSGYTWLGNHSRADEGVTRAGMVVAMAAMFVLALAIPDAWSGGSGSLVLVVAYLLVRWVHLAIYAVAAQGDPGLRRQVAVTWLPLAASAALLMSGALLGGWAQSVLFAVALVVDWVGVYLTTRHGHWRLRSPSHLTERHGLFMIVAIGESIVAVGTGAAGQPMSAALLLAAIQGIAVAVCLWWSYFDVVSRAAARRLRGEGRVRLAVQAYTYGHFPIIAGIVLTALGLEGVVAHAGDTEPLGAFSSLALYGGAALYLLGHLLFRLGIHHVFSRSHLVAAATLLAIAPVAAMLPPLAGPTGVIAVLTLMIMVETRRDAASRNGRGRASFQTRSRPRMTDSLLVEET
ncbi:low temperature requirement protein A [Streptosporangium sp. NPDC051023]|uniref:low temperature requirement protein A n=1 Tax=Streptosporangium sp. NPDC051023 TaxID=3155410 RepID=UPI00344D61CC